MQTQQGNILDVSKGIIAHQVNTLGIMGAGLALQIKKRYPVAFKDYSGFSSVHSEHHEELLGSTLLTQISKDLFKIGENTPILKEREGHRAQ